MSGSVRGSGCNSPGLLGARGNSRPYRDTERNWPDNQLIWRTRLTESPCCVRQPNWCADSRLAQPLFVSCLNFYHLSFQATRYKKRLVNADFLPISGLLKLSMRDVPCAI